jgi:hypothetical protein
VALATASTRCAAPCIGAAQRRWRCQDRGQQASAHPPDLLIGSQGDALWLPNIQRPEWLDGSLPGDRGFDPLALSRPADFVQIGVDGQDQNLAQNNKGSVEAIFAAQSDQVSENRLAPYSEVFGLARFRETELIHGRWAMLAALGVIVAETSTGVSWWVARRGGP